MEPIQAVVLGTVQGLTEFFPVSSSGHLVIFQQMMGFKEPDLLFDISVHVGTLAAIVVYFFSDIVNILKSLFLSVSSRMKGHAGQFTDSEIRDINMAWMIVAGSIPTAMIGFGLQMISDILFSSLLIVGVALLITGAVLLVPRWVRQKKSFDAKLSSKQALLIGTVQGLAVIPGISRSGSTISIALLAGVSRDAAIRFSFLLSIPAILGALMLQLFMDSPEVNGASGSVIFIGLVTSLIVGYGALSLLVKMVQKGHLYYFTPYCIFLGAVVLMAGG